MNQIKYTLCTLLVCPALVAFSQGKHADVLSEADSLYTIGNYKAAAGKYVTYLQDTSTNAPAWNRAGFSNQNIGNYAEALRDYQRSLANHPAPFIRSSVNSRMARILSIQNKTGDAAEALVNAAKLGFNPLPDLDTLADFKNLRQSADYEPAKKKITEIIYPCLADPHTHDFDFWVGEWDVYATGSRYLVGHSVVQNISGGCAILENWTSTQANAGKSINYYDPSDGKWHQDWVGSGQNISHYFNGEYRDGAMNFEYEGVNAKGAKIKGHFRFYHVDKDTVRQYLELSADGGKTYQPSYDFTYVRKKAVN
ncbi:MAG TPA: hypothetical protein VHE59_11130 [Mucilaginibacter sp.]|nr:hypothetical protein [Mucilaginibacter sp.]